MVSYLVRENVLIVDKDGNRTNQSSEYIFDDSSKSLIDLRSEAIEKGRNLIYHYEHGMPLGSEFSSPVVARLKEYKDFKAFSVEIILINENGDEDLLLGEDDCLDYIVSEADYYKDHNLDVEFEEVEFEGETYEILEKDSEFLMTFLFKMKDQIV